MSVVAKSYRVADVPVLVSDNQTGAFYVSAEVLDRLYKLICDQRIFFATRDKKLLQSCKDREDGFIDWWQRAQLAMLEHVNHKSSEQTISSLQDLSNIGYK